MHIIRQRLDKREAIRHIMCSYQLATAIRFTQPFQKVRESEMNDQSEMAGICF